VRGLDTNVLLRPLTQDDPAQAAVVRALFQAAEEQGEHFHVSTIVLCEVCWILRGYDYSRAEIAEALEKLLATPLFEIQDRELVRRALREYRTGRGDFADYLIGWQNRQAGCSDTVTFDGKLGRTPGFAVLEVPGTP
jgi:predicted nucleic-acid-binding protein